MNSTNTKHAEVLIAPLWNWNYEKNIPIQFEESSNRTFMELKSY